MAEWFIWFSEKFKKVLAENKVFESVVDERFGEGEVILRNLQSGVLFDVRKTLLYGPMEETIFKQLLTRTKKSGGIGIIESDSMDSKVCKIRDWVNNHLTYESDYKNYARPEMWATAYTVYDRKRDDCDGYAVLIMTLMRLAGVPAWRRRIAVGEVDSGEYHAYVVYLSEDYNEWFVVEGSYMANEAKTAFNHVPFVRNVRYKTPEWTFNEDKAWTINGREVFLTKITR